MKRSSIKKSMFVMVLTLTVTISILSFSLVQAHVIIDDATGGDCTLIGSWNVDSKTCTLASNINTTGSHGLEINSNNITVDGNNYTVQGNGSANTAGVYIAGKSYITIKNMSISNYTQHIELRNTADHNTLDNVTVGSIYIHSSSNIDISNSESQYVILYKSDSSSITDNTISFLDIIMSKSCTILRNDISSNLNVDGDYWDSSHWDHNITISNTIEGKPIYYIKNASGLIFDNSTVMGSFFCISCENITVDNLDLHESGSIYLYGTQNSTVKGNDNGIELLNCSDNSLVNNKGYIRVEWSSNNVIEKNNIISSFKPILLLSSNNNTVANNTISGSSTYGIDMIYSDNNSIRYNIVSGQIGRYGISLSYSGGNDISHNKISTVNAYAFRLNYSDNNMFDENVANSCQRGISIYSSDYNTIRDNTFSNNGLGIYLHGYMNTIYNNNFINNTIQASSADNAAKFNLETPIGGNYWSDWDTPAEGCQDLNLDSFCDSAYGVSYETWDDLPWTKKNGWKIQFPWHMFLPAITGGVTWYTDST